MLRIVTREKEVKARLLERRQIDENGCWLWMGYRTKYGHGTINLTRQWPEMVHRVAYREWAGPIEDGNVIHHLCRSRACFNPDHLEQMSRSDHAKMGKPRYAPVEHTHGYTTLKDKLLAFRRVSETGCWEWTGPLHKKGYAHVSADSKCLKVHRVAYEEWVGPIPEGLTIDHLCKNKRCFNPEHLEAVTNAENVKRSAGPHRGGRNKGKTHCKDGHELTPENTYVHHAKRGVMRRCKTCHRLYLRGFHKGKRGDEARDYGSQFGEESRRGRKNTPSSENGR
jgi:hypothetical protein